jgi:hypothetical protein
MRRPADPILLADFLRSAGVAYKLTSKSYVFTCPKCRKPEKLWMYQDGSRFICFSCPKFSGAVEWALAALTDRQVSGIRKAVYRNLASTDTGDFFFRIDPDAEEDDTLYEDPLSLEDAPDLAWPLDCVTLDTAGAVPGVEYLEGRGIPYRIAMEYDIRYSTEERAIVFPAYADDRLVGWQYRYLRPRHYTNKQGKPVVMKARSTEDIPRDRVLLFQNRLVPGGDAVLGEGPFDALAAHAWGGNVAAMGKEVSFGQILRIIRSGVKRVFIAVDPDAAAMRNDIVKQLHGSVEVFNVQIPSKYKDLGETPMDEAVDAIAAAKPANPGDINIYLG